MMKRKLAFIACLAAMLPAAPAYASSQDPDIEVMATGLAAPLHLAVGRGESVRVSQDFAGILTRVESDGSRKDVYTAKPGWEVAGVEIRSAGTYFLESIGAGQGKPDELEGYLKLLDPENDVHKLASFADFERKHNPDGDQHYGFAPGTSEECLAEFALLPDAPPAQYTGTVDSHPYALAVWADTAYVADAGMNAILEVDLESGKVSTLTVLPPRPAKISKDAAESMHVPACAGFQYAFEPVPTDVEIGPDGWLYVSSLPGGPEGPELGARGAIFKINPWNGDTSVWADHILSPTGLAVADNGDVYAASLFGGEILKFNSDAERSQFLKVNQPADVEYRDGDVFATVDALMGLPDPSVPDAPPAEPAGRLIEVD
ncbi:ScyD/ScyE family protein [Arthrobacter sp. OV608]|uniref:ScyD/ScyE family protein n=1 Tax=Arthrobacter sp. OV608 TaxID=1882768 RepID=UPI0008D2317B|nr:ScyD/ScyE family protein [Arthrobacter sp. OV608]SEQ13686.1 hypothetical protein SAMN05444745_10484 [Arthrobacter sp. OV608]